MKTLLLSVLLGVAGAAPAVGQAWTNPLPIDSATHKVTYSAVVQVPGASKTELYTRARAWFATSFASAKAVLEMDDAQAGQLVGRAYATALISSAGQQIEARIWRVIIVELKDGRYRYNISDFQLGSLLNPAANPNPIEHWLALATRNGTKPTKMSDSVIEGIKTTAESEVTSLSAAMKKAGAKSKDW